ncbi:MAG: LuxR C-terminal-related transcriptional regulator [Nitriliruptoraceae bacterium]
MRDLLIGRETELAAADDELASGSSVIVIGDAGVGKTRLSRAAAQRAEDRGWRVDTVAGLTATASLPFGAITRLLPAVEARDDPHLVRMALAHLRVRASTTSLLVVVDDAHLLDDRSAAVIGHLVLDGAIPCLLTVRTGETCPDPILGLWKDGHARRVDLDPLDRATTAELVATTIGGPASARLEDEIWRLSAGNPLCVRELITAARDARTLVERAGVWTSVEPLPASHRLTDLIAARLARLDPADRSAVELIAVGEPLGLQLALQELGSDRLERLETGRLLAVDHRAGVVRAVHPMYGEVLRPTMSRTRLSLAAAKLAELVGGADGTDPAEARKIAKLVLDAGGNPPAALALAGARGALAVLDVHLAERLAAAASTAHPFEAQLVLGRALRLQGRGSEARSTLEPAAAAAQGDDQIGRVALAAARNQLWVLGDLAAAQVTLEAALARIDDDAWKATVEAELALQLATAGDFREGARVARDALRRPGIGPRAELAALIVDTLGQSLQLDLDGLDATLARALELAATFATEEPLATDQLLLAAAEAERYQDPTAVLTSTRQRGRSDSPLLGTWRMATSMVALMTGDVTTAVVASHEALLLLERSDPFANLAMVRGVRGVALAQSTSPDPFGELRDQLVDPQLRVEPRARVWADRALAWDAIRTDPQGAIATAREGGRRALDDGNVGWGCDLLHDAVRFGGASEVVDLLAEATEGTSALIAGLYAEHGRSAAEHDPIGLEQVGDSFIYAGALLPGAEAFAQAATAWSAHGDGGAAARAAVRAQVVAGRCPGAATPALDGLGELGLPRRQLEILALAAHGRSNRDIADECVLSLRTVENHLSRAYRSLEIEGRTDLAALFA